MSLFFKIICIILASVLCLGAVSNFLDIDLPDLSNKGGGTATVKPVEPSEPEEPTEPEETFDLTNWHVSEHDNLCEPVVECSACGSVYVSPEGLSFLTECFSSPWYTSTDYRCSCDNIISFDSLHCFVNGTCHTCGMSCNHTRGEGDEYTISYLPEGHPLKDIEGGILPDSYIVDGLCLVCGIEVVVEEPEEPEEPVAVFDIKNWHSDNYCGTTIITSCGQCGETADSADQYSNEQSLCDYVSDLGHYSEYNCCYCGDGLISILVQHCYEDGVCHLCNNTCSHTAKDQQTNTNTSMCLPDEHPLKELLRSNSVYENDVYDFDHDSYCDICGMHNGTYYD